MKIPVYRLTRTTAPKLTEAQGFGALQAHMRGERIHADIRETLIARGLLCVVRGWLQLTAAGCAALKDGAK